MTAADLILILQGYAPDTEVVLYRWPVTWDGPDDYYHSDGREDHSYEPLHSVTLDRVFRLNFDYEVEEKPFPILVLDYDYKEPT